MMSRLFLAFILTVAVVACGAGSTAASEFEGFGFESVNAEESTAGAGQHPDLFLDLAFNHQTNGGGAPIATARLEDLSVGLPAGLLGNPNVVPKCTAGQLLAMGNCPVGAQVGIVRVVVSELGEAFEPIYNMEPPHGRDAVARLGFVALAYPAFIDISVRTAGDYGVTATVHDANGQGPVISAETVLWGAPADPIHDKQRLIASEATSCPDGTACKAPGGKRSSGLVPRPFLTNPTACEEQEIEFTATTYQLPGQLFTAQASLPPITDCAEVPFAPTLDVDPTTPVAGAATGLSAVLQIPQSEDIHGRASSAMRAAKVTLPEGMTISASAAEGLEACSPEQVAFGQEMASSCPEGAKLGIATFVSPSLPEPLHGTIYQRSPEPSNLFRVWLVADEFGLHIKLPGRIAANPHTGQLTAEFEELPQVPLEEIDLEFKGGPQAPLKNPDFCGTFTTTYELTPWSGNPPVVGQSQMTIKQGCNVGFSPKLNAGVTKPVAGAFSPLVFNLIREDAEDNVSWFELSLPSGELAKLAGVPLCLDDAASTGNCPDATRIGSARVAVGAGEQPLWVPPASTAASAVFLAGPYRGAPYSIVTKVPAQAGPFDLGTVVVRSGIDVTPETGRVTVKTDPLPQILEGVPVLYRTIHVLVDRENFTINPTDCRVMAVQATVAAAHGSTADPKDRFQVGGCARLGFRPRLSLRLRGNMKRRGYPALRAVVKTKGADANIGRVSVTLPHSELLAQEHIQTICTRVQFAAEDCPAASIYGYAKAITPLLDQPLEGPVYLRSSNNPLPDLVAALRGQLAIDLVGQIDSVDGGIRTTFKTVPDAPVSKFVLKMQGGQRGLLVNSQHVCRHPERAAVKIWGQNGRKRYSHPRLLGRCGKS